MGVSLLGWCKRGKACYNSTDQSVLKIKLRILNHWTISTAPLNGAMPELSIWNWHELPAISTSAILTHARANASIGINGNGADQ